MTENLRHFAGLRRQGISVVNATEFAGTM